MRHSAHLGGILAVASMPVGPTVLTNQPSAASLSASAFSLKLPTSDGKTRRSTVKPDRAAKRSNMNHVSRRTKRKHRRNT